MSFFLMLSFVLLGSASVSYSQTTLPISDTHVAVSSASVTGLECKGRKFSMDYTKAMGRRYKYFARNMVTEGWDPRPLAVGVIAMIATTPFAILAVPVDLAAAPLRKECSFEFTAQGTLVKWANQTPGVAEVGAAGRNMLVEGTEGVSRPEFYVSRASTTSDENGRFTLTLPGHTGISKDLDIGWTVNGLASGLMVLTQHGATFTLAEPEPEFGSAIDTIDPIDIRPERRR